MSKAASELQKAFMTKDEVEKLLANLEELKADGSVTAEQYKYLNKEYKDRLAAADSGIAQQRVQLKSQLEGTRTSLANNNMELDRLALRFKVGELPLEQYERSERKLQKRIGKLQAEIAELETLLAAESSGDIGVLPTRAGGTSGRSPGFSVPEASSFTAFVSSLSEVVSPRIRLLGLVGGFFLFISVFMPWASSGGLGFRISYVAADLSGHLTAAGIIFGLLSIAAAFLAEPQTRGFVHIGSGAIALLILLIVMVVPQRGIEDSIVGAISRGWITIGAGLVFYIIAAIVVVVGGVFARLEG